MTKGLAKRSLLVQFDLVIPAGETTSNSVDLEGRTIIAILTPDSLVSDAITFEVSADGETDYRPLYLRNTAIGGLYTVEVGPTRHIVLEPIDTVSFRGIRIITNSEETSGAVIVAVTAPVLYG